MYTILLLLRVDFPKKEAVATKDCLKSSKDQRNLLQQVQNMLELAGFDVKTYRFEVINLRS